MFTLKKKESRPDPLDELIENHISEMAGHEVHSDEYTLAAANLKVLMDAKAAKPERKSVTPDTIATVAANLAGILLILNYERANVLTSKSLSLLLKPKS